MRTLAALAAAALLSGFTVAAQGPAVPPGFAARPLFDNASVGVMRLLISPGAREMPHAHPYSMLVVQVSPGDVEIMKAGAVSRAARPVGHIEFFDANMQHAAANVGNTPVAVLVISFKPDRLRGGTAPALPRPQGITSTDVFDSADAAVRRVEFAPGAREVIHTHPYDFVLVPAVHGRIDVHLAGKDETKDYAPGDAVFIARNTPHSVANVGRERFALLGVTIK
jgi:quercetin dioxygenase-like cupin family protein